MHFKTILETQKIAGDSFSSFPSHYFDGGMTMDTNERLRLLLAEHGWTEYRLAKQCGLSQSTITNIYRRNTVPSIPTLEVICKGLGITLPQFFAEGGMTKLPPDLEAVSGCWGTLDPYQEKRSSGDESKKRAKGITKQ